jgi:DNA mismatch endonuclease (patch repair protein)
MTRRSPAVGEAKPQRESWASSPRVRASMRSNRPRDTRPELALRKAMHRLGLRYRVSARPLPGIHRTADVVFVRAKVAVFLDGCFWHGCPEHHTVAITNADYWAEKVRHNRQRDIETDEILSSSGWQVIRVWEHEDTTAAAERIATAVRDRTRKTTGHDKRRVR